MGRKLKCIIVDDEQHAIELLRLHLSKVSTAELVFASTNPVAALEYVQSHPVDLIFLDIQMPDLNGMDFLRLLGGKCQVILSTAYREHALDSYEFNALDYLLKPITFERFLKALQKANPAVQDAELTAPGSESSLEEDHFFVKTGVRNKVEKINFSDIQYVESQGNYAIFHLVHSSIKTLASLKSIEEKLPQEAFLRIHHSFIIAQKLLQGVEGNTVLTALRNFPVGEKYRSKLAAYIGKKTLN